MEWTEELIGRLRQLWDQGLPTAEIGRQLSISKNAVVGKAHRLKLPSRPSPIRNRSNAGEAGETASRKRVMSPRVTKPSGGQLAQGARKAASSSKPGMKEAAAKGSTKTGDKAIRSGKERISGSSAESGHEKGTLPTGSHVRHGESSARPDTALTESSRSVPQQRPVSASSSQMSKPTSMVSEKKALPQSGGGAANMGASRVQPAVPVRPAVSSTVGRARNPLDGGTRYGSSCQWPSGNPGEPDFRFCGAPSLPGKPYCAEHAAIAYVKIRDRRD